MATKKIPVQPTWQQVAGLSGVYALRDGRTADLGAALSLAKRDQTSSKVEELRRELTSFALSRGVKPR